MAKVKELDQEALDEWVSTRPPVVQELCRRLPPDRLYRMKSSGHRVTLYSYAEDGTVTVNVCGDWNVVTFERRVFGVSPDDLEECDVPDNDEPRGALLTERKDIDAHIEELREHMGMKGSNVQAQPTAKSAAF